MDKSRRWVRWLFKLAGEATCVTSLKPFELHIAVSAPPAAVLVENVLNNDQTQECSMYKVNTVHIY